MTIPTIRDIDVRKFGKTAIKQILLDMEQNNDYSPKMFKRIAEIAEHYSKALKRK